MDYANITGLNFSCSTVSSWEKENYKHDSALIAFLTTIHSDRSLIQHSRFSKANKQNEHVCTIYLRIKGGLHCQYGVGCNVM